MKKTLTGACLTLLVLLLTACAALIGLEVTNNTGQDITVLSIDQKGNETPYLLGNGQTSEVKVGSKYRIKHNNTIWDYDFPQLPPRNHLKKIARNVYVERVQIEKEGIIYELAPNSPKGSTTNFPPQPPGYPIRPKAN